jgi:hypothetical protein
MPPISWLCAVLRLSIRPGANTPTMRRTRTTPRSASTATSAAAAQLTATGYAAKVAVAAASAAQAPGGTAGDLRALQHELFAARRAVVMFGNNVNQAVAAFNATGQLPEWAADAVRLCMEALAQGIVPCSVKFGPQCRQQGLP